MPFRTWFQGTHVRKGNFGNFNNNISTIQAADLVIIGRTLGSGDYANGVADGYNTVTTPVSLFNSYVVRETDNRLSWNTLSVDTGTLTAENETTVTAAGAALFGIPQGAADFFEDNRNGHVMVGQIAEQVHAVWAETSVGRAGDGRGGLVWESRDQLPA